MPCKREKGQTTRLTDKQLLLEKHAGMTKEGDGVIRDDCLEEMMVKGLREPICSLEGSGRGARHTM